MFPCFFPFSFLFFLLFHHSLVFTAWYCEWFTNRKGKCLNFIIVFMLDPGKNTHFIFVAKEKYVVTLDVAHRIGKASY